MTVGNRSEEVKCEPDPKDGIETREALTDEQLASLAAGRLAASPELLKEELARPLLERAAAPVEGKRLQL